MKELLRFVSVISIAISLFSCASENIFSEENLEQSNIENVQIVRDFEVEITAPIPGVWKRMVEIGYTVKTGDAIGIIENDKGIFMIEVPDKDGKEIEFEVLFTFESDETKKNYMVYTDNSTDEEGNVRVYASVFKPDAEPLELLPVETEREWKIIETILDSIQEENKKNSEESN